MQIRGQLEVILLPAAIYFHSAKVRNSFIYGVKIGIRQSANVMSILNRLLQQLIGLLVNFKIK